MSDYIIVWHTNLNAKNQDALKRAVERVLALSGVVELPFLALRLMELPTGRL